MTNVKITFAHRAPIPLCKCGHTKGMHPYPKELGNNQRPCITKGCNCSDLCVEHANDARQSGGRNAI